MSRTLLLFLIGTLIETTARSLSAGPAQPRGVELALQPRGVELALQLVGVEPGLQLVGVEHAHQVVEVEGVGQPISFPEVIIPNCSPRLLRGGEQKVFIGESLLELPLPWFRENQLDLPIWKRSQKMSVNQHFLDLA